MVIVNNLLFKTRVKCPACKTKGKFGTYPVCSCPENWAVCYTCAHEFPVNFKTGYFPGENAAHARHLIIIFQRRAIALKNKAKAKIEAWLKTYHFHWKAFWHLLLYEPELHKNECFHRYEFAGRIGRKAGAPEDCPLSIVQGCIHCGQTRILHHGENEFVYLKKR